MTIPKINYEPRGDRVIVKRLPPPKPREGEVVVPNSQRKELNEGIVYAVGPGARNRITGQVDPVDLEVGQHVCFLDFAGSDIEVDGEVYLSMRDEEVHGVRPKINGLAPKDFEMWIPQAAALHELGSAQSVTFYGSAEDLLDLRKNEHPDYRPVLVRVTVVDQL